MICIMSPFGKHLQVDNYVCTLHKIKSIKVLSSSLETEKMCLSYHQYIFVYLGKSRYIFWIFLKVTISNRLLVNISLEPLNILRDFASCLMSIILQFQTL